MICLDVHNHGMFILLEAVKVFAVAFLGLMPPGRFSHGVVCRCAAVLRVGSTPSHSLPFKSFKQLLPAYTPPGMKAPSGGTR
jgi:hypothetical protein